MLKKGDTAGIVCCSDGIDERRRGSIARTKEQLEQLGLHTVESPFLYRRESLASGSPAERAEVLNQMYRDPGIRAIFDVSGGNLANQVLEYLDYELLRREGKEIWGYSDLTVLLNAVYAKTGCSSWLYQVRNLSGKEGEIQKKRMKRMMEEQDETALMPDDWEFLQGNRMEGVVLGGNIRCFLKLAGTEYFPDMENKILFLESYGGGIGVITSLLTQLRQMGVFRKIGGLLLGTFTELDEAEGKETIEKLVIEIIGTEKMAVARSMSVGHGEGSCGMHIGKKIRIGYCSHA